MKDFRHFSLFIMLNPYTSNRVFGTADPALHIGFFTKRLYPVTECIALLSDTSIFNISNIPEYKDGIVHKLTNWTILLYIYSIDTILYSTAHHFF